MDRPWYQSFFTPLALEFWRAAVPAEATLAETDFLERWLLLRPEASLLDLPCGLGRHAIALAERGYRVTGIESLVICGGAGAARGGRARALREFVRGELRDPPPGAPFDGALCMGNSFGYLDAEGTRSFARNVLRSLRPGGRWVIDTGCAAESLLPPPPRGAAPGGRRHPLRGEEPLRRARGTARLRVPALARRRARARSLQPRSLHGSGDPADARSRARGRVIAALGSCDDAPYAVGERRLLLVAERLDGTASASR